MLNDSVLKNHRPALPQHRQLFTDAIVTVGAEDFQVHRGILSAASPYFHFLFSSRMQEGGPFLSDILSSLSPSGMP